ncbi:type IV toxin-antitoxin system AbiEi family antitoxin domain-containing protein [Agromyces aerolatus]|uniref:type IV toxin-antitoxin system AbiEi family antitoxin domain-containing protein n=1 Tax=Agromyces sp. LY-1074 TaxID=3074080 RepID=UPI002856F044|nr:MULTISPECIES: type IV toxin-antitoxin system AbiEi family antitoxin domain-containing protein [unclassified Agromyces]MDR5701029.1 type IV toxin-antitoxin system AbiEi family antitoxin domain-containing protein [Agromyces sp. LY-1074]MDR5707669.1 type IV toxin-antitoxin system AbiEi family antitoxin domain-containing protein [Agromyces sp. LY-1358]
MYGRLRLEAAFGRARIARTAELASAGIGQHALRHAVREGTVLRLRQGVYALPGVGEEARLAACHGGMLACVSAARAVGLWVLDDDRLHIAVGTRDRTHPHPGCRCRTHRVARATLGARTTVRRALIQIYRCRGPEAFFVSLESALRQGRVSRTGLAAIRTALPGAGTQLVDLARCDADSGLESLMRLRLLGHGISLAAQVEIPGVGRVDFVLGDRLILEVDGRGNHDGPSMRHKDLVRDAAAAALGFDTLRFDYAMVVHDWPSVLAAILAKVDAGLHMSR